MPSAALVVVLCAIPPLLIWLRSRARQPAPGQITLPSPPETSFILGHVSIVQHPQAHLIYTRSFEELGSKTIQLRLLNKRAIVTGDKEIAMKLFRDRPVQFRRMKEIAEAFDDFVGPGGVFHSEAATGWSRLRKLSVPAFSPSVATAIFPTLLIRTAEMRDDLKQLCEKTPELDMKHFIERLMMKIFVGTIFGRGEDDMELMENLTFQFGPVLSSRLKAPIPYWKWLPTPIETRAAAVNKSVRAFTTSLIDEHKAKSLAKMAANENGSAEKSSYKPKSLMEVLMDGNLTEGDKKLTDDELHGMVLTWILAVSWLVHFLAKYPKIQTRIQQEVDTVLGANARLPVSSIADAISHADIKKLAYTERVVKETIRTKSTAPVIYINTTTPTALDAASTITATPDDLIIIDLQNVLHDETTFPDPTAFNPDRWENATDEMDKCVMMAFGGGPRICPGRHFAILESILVAAIIFAQFDISMLPASECKGDPKLRNVEADPKAPAEILLFTMQPDEVRVGVKARVF
ncbi:lanosterol 14-alpha-demethylase [Borealophlyctis nickersoniae]|nr:lanosterol 14-alpha-demethylase [Borealophlyctis nickersoniae]